MKFTKEQLKGRLKNIANQNDADARVLLRSFMMERFLERLSESEYVDRFLIKGGILVTSMVRMRLRSTMDIDASVTGFDLTEKEAEGIVKDIINIPLDDGVVFEIKTVDGIMDDMEYPGIRVSLEAYMDQIECPLKIDISTGDVITPRAIQFNYGLLLEDRSIQLKSYSIISYVETDSIMRERWGKYRKKYQYAQSISFDGVMQSVRELADRIFQR